MQQLVKTRWLQARLKPFDIMILIGCLGSIVPANSEESQKLDEWTRFRGPNGSGIGTAKNLPVKWTEKDFAWKTNLPGVGHSSPVLWGDRIFSTCADEQDGTQFVIAHDALTGKEIWKRQFESQKYPHHKFNSFASASPCVDGKRLFVSWTTKHSNDLLCLDHDGNLLWRRDFGKYDTQHGNGFSPMVHGEMVVLTHDHYGSSSILALDCKTGKTKWQTSRNSGKPSSSTPCFYQPANGPLQFICNSMAHGCYGVDARTGKILWETGPDTLDLRSVSSPFIASGHVFASCGSGSRGSRFAAVVPPTKGKGSPKIAYAFKKSIPYVPTPIAKDDLLFLVTDGGIASCHDLATGELKWRERLQGNYFASPILVNEVIYAVSKEGKVISFKATADFQLLGNSELGELTYNTPAVANGSLYFRTYSGLIRLTSKSSE